MVPLSFFPQPIAASFWYLVNVASLILSITIALYLNEGARVPIRNWISEIDMVDRVRKLTLVFALILSARFWLNSIEHGQVNLLLWCIVLVAILSFRLNKVLIGSALLSLSIIIKILPALFLFYYLLRRKFNIVVLSLFWIGLFLVIPAVVLGWEYNLDLLTAWYHKILEPNFTQGAIGVGDSNQSFPAMLTRFLSATSANEETGATVNFLSLSDKTISLLKMLSSFVFLAVIAGLALFGKEKSVQRENLELSIVLLSAVLMPMLAWKAYFVASTMGYTAIVYLIIKAQDKRQHRFQIALVSASFVLHTLTSDGIWGWKLAHVFQSYSCVTFSMLLLYAALMMTSLQRTQVTTNQSYL